MIVTRWTVRKVSKHGWAVFPPGWDDDLEPLVAYTNWRQAYRSAASRADFAMSPSPNQEPPYLRGQNE